MSVFVKGMEMPKVCGDCAFLEWYNGLWYCHIKNDMVQSQVNQRYEDCPLVEVPTPHGRLIDADAILEEAKRISGPITGDGWDNYGVYALIERQPTVMEAEEANND